MQTRVAEIEDKLRAGVLEGNPLKILRDLVKDEFECAICLDTCTDTHVNPRCGHRFCNLCIKKSLSKCRNECPNCRSHIPTYRSLRVDAQFDRILSKVQQAITVLKQYPTKDLTPNQRVEHKMSVITTSKESSVKKRKREGLRKKDNMENGGGKKGATGNDKVAKVIHQDSAEVAMQKPESSTTNKKIRVDNSDIIDLTGEPEDDDQIKVKTRILVWWPYEKQYYSGTVDMIENDKSDPHHVLYDDGDEQWTNLFQRDFKRIDTSASSSDLSTTRLTDDLSMASIKGLSRKNYRGVTPHTSIQACKSYVRNTKKLKAIESSKIDLGSDESNEFQKSTRTNRPTATNRTINEHCDHTTGVAIGQTRDCKDKCCICKNEAKTPRATSCHHIFCKACINSEKVGLCPICNKDVETKLQKYQPDKKTFKAVEAISVNTAAVLFQYNSASGASLERQNLSPSRIIEACSSFQRDDRLYQGYYWRFAGSNKEFYERETL